MIKFQAPFEQAFYLQAAHRELRSDKFGLLLAIFMPWNITFPRLNESNNSLTPKLFPVTLDTRLLEAVLLHLEHFIEAQLFSLNKNHKWCYLLTLKWLSSATGVCVCVCVISLCCSLMPLFLSNRTSLINNDSEMNHRLLLALCFPPAHIFCQVSYLTASFVPRGAQNSGWLDFCFYFAHSSTRVKVAQLLIDIQIFPQVLSDPQACLMDD